jgi:hypothetical protein
LKWFGKYGNDDFDDPPQKFIERRDVNRRREE